MGRPSEINHGTVRKAFVLLSGLVLAVFFMIQSWSAVENSGPAARVQELVSAIDAELIERPVTAAQANYGVELADSGKQVRTSVAQLLQAATKGDTRGVVFLNFWATWCKPCVRELPSMLELKRTMAGHNFTMLAVSYDEDWKSIGDFFRRVFGGTPRELVVARDPNASAEEQTTLKYAFGTSKLPETYVIKNGKVITRFVNERNWTDPAIVEYFKRLAEMP